jgi:hypothetical protein
MRCHSVGCGTVSLTQSVTQSATPNFTADQLSCDSRLRRRGQRDRNARARGEFKGGAFICGSATYRPADQADMAGQAGIDTPVDVRFQRSARCGEGWRA